MNMTDVIASETFFWGLKYKTMNDKADNCQIY